MIVPQFWAEARLQKRLPDRQLTVRRFGWSDVSLQAAQEHADQRAEEAMGRICRGESLPRREKKVRYNGADGLPIREEIVERVCSETVVTRNSYGARCLNTPHVFFADVDFTAPHTNSFFAWVVEIGCVATIAITIGFWSETFRGGLLSFLLLFALINFSKHWLTAISLKIRGGKEQIAWRKIESFTDANRDWHLRIYRTPNGYRLLAMHKVFDPRSEEVERAFARLGVDSTYSIMCQKQNCFRARLTAKPWRIGIDNHLKPRPGVWPIAESYLPQRKKWIRKYESAAANYAACRFVKATGPTQMLTTATQSACEYHDRVCQANEALPLA